MQETAAAVAVGEVGAEAEADEADSGTEADGAAEVVTTTLALPMQMVGRVADKLLPPRLLLRLLLLAERFDECAKRTVRMFWWYGFLDGHTNSPGGGRDVLPAENERI